jgi:TM2 domain-containing membrane protein YozV
MPPARKNKWTGLLLSLFIPGFGQIYAGRPERGGAILVASVLVFSTAYLFIATTADRGILYQIGARYLQLLAILFWAWQAYDAYQVAKPPQE